MLDLLLLLYPLGQIGLVRHNFNLDKFILAVPYHMVILYYPPYVDVLII